MGAAQKIKVEEKKRRVILTNELVKISFDLDSGLFDIRSITDDSAEILNAYSSVQLKDGDEIKSSDSYQRRWSEREVNDRHGRGIEVTLTHSGLSNQPDLGVSITIYEGSPLFIIQTMIENRFFKPIGVEKFKVLNILPSNGGRLNLPSKLAQWCFYKNGWYSWDTSYCLRMDEGDFKPSRDGDFISPLVKCERPGEFVSAWMAFLANPRTKEAILCGFGSMRDQISQVSFVVEDLEAGLVSLTAQSYADGHPLEPGKRLYSEKLGVNGNDKVFESLDRYVNFCGQEMAAIGWDQIPTGWCSWYYYFSGISESAVLENLEYLADHRAQIPVEYIQVDDGYQAGVGDWLSPNEKFPHGMKWLAARIKAKGFKPGLWLAPFCVGANSKIYHQHPEWVVKDEEGNPVPVFKNWGTEVYGLDCTNPEVQKWLRELFQTIVGDWGYEYLKIDFGYSAAIRGSRYDPGATRIQAYRKGLEIIREAVGDRFILGCGAPLGPSVGLVNAMRIGEDVGPSLRGSYSVFNSCHAVLTRYFMHQSLWVNDPDCLIVRDEGSELSLEETRTLVTVIGLSGGMVLLSDNMPALPPQRLALIPVTLPSCGSTARPIDLLEKRTPEIFDLPIEREFGSWHVVGVFNWSSTPEDLALDFSELGLDPQAEHHVFEFWAQRYYGKLKNRVVIKKLKSHSCKLLSIKPVTGHPQIVSTTFHLTQGGVDLEEARYHPRDRRLDFTLNPGKRISGKVFLYVPDGLRIKGLESDASRCNESNHDDSITAIELEVDKRASCRIWLEPCEQSSV